MTRLHRHPVASLLSRSARQCRQTDALDEAIVAAILAKAAGQPVQFRLPNLARAYARLNPGDRA